MDSKIVILSKKYKSIVVFFLFSFPNLWIIVIVSWSQIASYATEDVLSQYWPANK